ncbi:MAG: hypothetical protein ACLPI9_04790 [Halobacteriota archaeon]|jgi:hypothetical protein
MARKRTGPPDLESKLVPVPTVFITESLHFETEYLALRLTDAFHVVEKKEELIRSAIKCLDTVITNDAEMGMLRRECSLYQIRIDPDKAQARAELQEQLAELDEQHKTLEAVLSAVEEAAKSPRTITPEYEKFAADSRRVVLASLSGKVVRFQSVGDPHPLEPIETSDPRVVAELIRHHIGRPTVIE